MVVCKPGKPGAVEVDREGLIGEAEGIDTHVELPSPEKQWVEDVALAYIVFDIGILGGAFPFGDITDFVKDEDAFALALGGLRRGWGTGFMIHRVLPSASWYFLNSSKKMTYSLGMRKVGGRKSYSLDSWELPCFSRCLLNFLRFLLRVSLRHNSFHPRK